VPKLDLKGKISKGKKDKVSNYLAIFLAVLLAVYYILFLGVFGLWYSVGAWISVLSLTAISCFASYRLLNKVAFKRFLAFAFLCILFATPIFAISEVVQDQSMAQNLSATKKVNYFRTLLGTSYNYTQLIVWENQHLNFTYSNIPRNTDPIRIFQYGEGRCGEFAILYAELCISQGYRCRIVDNVFNDHEFNEVLLTNGTWIRVDASLNSTSSRAVGYPTFFVKEKGWGAPILSFAFENSSIVDVTSTYNNNGFRLDSPITITLLILICAISIIAIVKYLIQPSSRIFSAKPTDRMDRTLYY
jgi:hypothetical protein